MLRKRSFFMFLIVLMLFILTLYTGCGRFFAGPLEGDGGEEELLDPGDPEVPPVPEELGVAEDEEPTIDVYISESGTVENMPFEEYIMGVVAAEMNPEWPVEALAAQAIIARTFTLQKIDDQGGVPQRNAHASSDIKEFQAYNPAEITDNVRAAVEETRGEVIVRDNEFIRAWFHAYAGTRTAQADEGLGFEDGNPPYIHVVDSPGTEIIPPDERDWQESFPASRVREVVREITGEDPGQVTSMEVAEEGPSGRATIFRVNDVEVDAPEFRLAIGSTEMRSTMMTRLDVEGSNIVMEGTGYGHGVGMCQWGARALAEKGQAPEEIVHYFYQDVELAKLWS